MVISPSSGGTSEGIVDSGNNPTRKGRRRPMTRTKAADAERKRQARKKRREAKNVVANKRDAFESKREIELRQQIARLKTKLEYDSDPQRGIERIDRAIRWLHEADGAAGDLATLTRISRELRATLDSDYIGELSIINREMLPSWNGYSWGSAGDLRKVVMADLKQRGLLEQFEREQRRKPC
jgi:hypothetical protein